MVNYISAEDLLKKIENKDDFKLLDVLLAAGYDKWHIPGAINIAITEFENTAPHVLDKSDKIIIYCSSTECKSSSRAAKILENRGFTDVSEFSGGKKEWMEKNYPVEKEK